MKTTTAVSVTIDDDVLRRVDEMAKVFGHSRSEHMTFLLREALKREEKEVESVSNPLVSALVQAITSPTALKVLAPLFKDVIPAGEQGEPAKTSERVKRTLQRIQIQKRNKKAGRPSGTTPLLSARNAEGALAHD